MGEDLEYGRECYAKDVWRRQLSANRIFSVWLADFGQECTSTACLPLPCWASLVMARSGIERGGKWRIRKNADDFELAHVVTSRNASANVGELRPRVGRTREDMNYRYTANIRYKVIIYTMEYDKLVPMRS